MAQRVSRTILSHRQGFTIVELLIVIVVIAILAAITLVSYNSIQARARDTVRKSGLRQLGQALQIYATQKGDWIEDGSGWGLNGNGNGWLSAGPGDLGSLYPRSVVSCLQDSGMLREGTFVDPTGCKWDSGGTCGSYRGSPARAYMKATCLTNGAKTTYLLARLETEPDRTAQIDALCDPGTLPGYTATGQKWGTDYGMNYFLALQ